MSSNVWVVSDTHFGHENIIKYAGRPFASVVEMNTAIVERWNAVVKPEDRVYHLGDFAVNRKHLNQTLNGRVVLIKGNHDNWKLAEFMAVQGWKLDDIRASQTRGGKETPFIMTHIPIWTGFHVLERFRVNVHGHMHEKPVLDTRFPDLNVEDPRYINVCVEHTNYTPMHMDDLIEKVKHAMAQSEVRAAQYHEACKGGCP